MQEIYKTIFELAKGEVPHKLLNFHNETCIIFKGFKTGERDGIYFWKDVRNDDYYEDVYPLITEKVLELGFVKTIHLIMIHDDANKLLFLKRKINRIDVEIEYWVTMAIKAYNKYREESKEASIDRKATVLKAFNRKKRLYEKKRRILKEEKDDISIDINFYENRIKNFNHN